MESSSSSGADSAAPPPFDQTSDGSPTDADTSPPHPREQEKSRRRKPKADDSDPEWLPDADLAKEIEQMRLAAQPKVTELTLARLKKDGYDLYGNPCCEQCAGKNSLLPQERRRGYCEECAEEMAAEEAAKEADGEGDGERNGEGDGEGDGEMDAGQMDPELTDTQMTDVEEGDAKAMMNAEESDRMEL